MTLDLFKAQTRRLQSYLKANPTRAQSLAQGQHAACLEAIAAVHGTRSWNALQALPAATSEVALPPGRPRVRQNPAFYLSNPPDLPACFEVKPGQVVTLTGASGTGKSFQVACQLVDALGDGYGATILDVGRSYHHLALAFGGISSTPEELEFSTRLSRAVIATVEFESWVLSHASKDGISVKDRWSRCLPYLHARLRRGQVVIVDEVWQLSRLFGDQVSLLVEYLVQARKAGCVIVLVGQSQSDFEFLKNALPADHGETLLRVS